MKAKVLLSKNETKAVIKARNEYIRKDFVERHVPSPDWKLVYDELTSDSLLNMAEIMDWPDQSSS